MNVNKNESEVLEMENIVIEIKSNPYKWDIELDIVEGSEMEGRTLQVIWDAGNLRGPWRVSWEIVSTY